MNPPLTPLAGPFPAGPEWAAEARSRLELGVGDPTVRAAAQGWMRLGSTRDAVLVDTLFVLTDDRLGFGQTKFETTDPNWVELTTVQAIDLIEGVPYPLDAIEVQFVGGLAIFVGWPEEFTGQVLARLASFSAPTMPPLFTPGPSFVDEMQAPSAPLPTVAPAAEFDHVGPDDDRFDDVEIVDVEVVEDGEQDAEPARPSTTVLEMFAVDEPTAEQRLAEEAFFGHLEAEEHPTTGAVPVVGDRAPESAEAEVAPGPWDDPYIAWPEAFEDSAYLGGHPIHQRRRKSCTLLLERKGLLAATPRMGWQLHVPWNEVSRLDVQGSDEVKFTHNQRVSSDSSVLVVDLLDQTTLLFEVRSIRPATVRAAIQPIRDAVARVHTP